MLSQKLYQLLVDLAREHHLYHINGGVIGISETVDKSALDIELFEHIAYLGTAAVYKDYLYTYQRQEDDICHNSVLELLVGHGVSAVLDNEYLVIILLYIRQCVNEHL